MRLVIQRVVRAAVHIDGTTISSIDRGLCVLVGLTHDDTQDDIEWAARKVLSVRFWDAWKKNVVEQEYSILSVSQFTLFAQLKGNKMDFRRALGAEKARDMYNVFLDQLRAAYVPERVHDGEFGAMMDVEIHNDGPVTLILDSRDR